MHTYILIDKSSSMTGRWSETIAAANDYITAMSEKKKTKFTIATFTGGHSIQFELLRRSVKVKDITKLSETETYPGGMTPLYDAIGKIGSLVLDDKAKKAALTILTDGEENCSRELNRETAKTLLDNLRDKGYDVSFIGADFDAFDQASSVGTTTCDTMNITAGNYAEGMASVAAKNLDYENTGQTRGFTDEERKKASGS